VCVRARACVRVCACERERGGGGEGRNILTFMFRFRRSSPPLLKFQRIQNTNLQYFNRANFWPTVVHSLHRFWFTVTSDYSSQSRYSTYPNVTQTLHQVICEPKTVGWGTALKAGRSRVQFPMVSLEFFIDIFLPAALWPWSWLRLQQKWVPGIFPEGKGGRCVRLTTLPPSCADCLEIWEPQLLGILWACPDL